MVATVLVLGVALVLGCLALGRRRGGVLAGLGTLLGLRLVTGLDAALADRLPARLSGVDVEITGVVCDFPREDPDLSRFILEPLGAARPPGVPGRILVSWYRPGQRPAIGETWRFTLRLRPPRGSANPGGFDFSRWALARGIGATAYVRDWPAPVRAGSGHCPLGQGRGAIAAAIEAAVGQRPALPYLLGLSVGAYQALPPAEWTVLRLTGTLHLISISGFHVALVAAPFLGMGLLAGRWLLGRGVSCAPPVLGACTGLAAAVAYGGLAGFPVPTLRSVLMLAVVAGLVILRQPLGTVRVLGLALVAVLLMEPLGPLLPGFWLSFGGVALLAVGAGLFPRVPAPSWPGRLAVLVRGFLGLQLVLSAGLAPLQVLFFGQVPLLGGLANLVAIPAFSFVLLPLILLGTVLVAAWPVAGGVLLGWAATAVELWRDLNGAFAALPAAGLHSTGPGAAAHGLAVLGLAGLLVPRPWPWRWLFLPLLLPVLAGRPPPPGPGELSVQVLDVGQGTAVLVRTRHHSLLHDTGPGFPGEGAGLLPVLGAAGLSDLDALVVSHGDLDHAGGAAAVLDAHPGARFWSSGFHLPGHTARHCVAGQGWWWDGHRFEFLHPAAARPDPGNDDSCVLRITGPGGRVLLTGDISRSVETRLVDQGLVENMDLVLAAHHGSRTSSHPALIAATRPRYVVFSAGFGNRWGFPVPTVLADWLASGACVLSTATGGSLHFSGGPGRPLALASRHRVDAGGPWQRGPSPCRPVAVQAVQASHPEVAVD